MVYLTPISEWFYGKDIIIDILSFLIIITLLIYSVRYYRINRFEKKYVYLISSFTLLSVSFLAKVLSHIIIYANNIDSKHMSIIGLTYLTINNSNLIVFWGLFIYRTLSIFALYLFYLIYSEKLDLKNQSLIIYLLMLIAYLGHSEYYIYHITISVLLLLNIFSLRSRFIQKKTITTQYLIYGFILLLISQIIFIFIFLNPILYLMGEVIQMLGYLSILMGFIKVITHGVKEKRTH